MNQLETIAGQLEKLQGEAYLQLKEGPLKESLLKVAAAEEEGPFSREGELEVVVARRPDDAEPRIALRAKDQGDGARLEVAASALDREALEEIAAYLVALTEKEGGAAPLADDEEGGEGSDTFGMTAAANRLRVSPAWLKSVIPCTFYTYEEIDGRKKIKEYFWSRELIRLLHQLRSKKASAQEVEFIAEHCCEGDIAWSREIIGKLKSYSRTEAQQKGQQPQKGQPQKSQQQKAQPQKGQQKVQQPQRAQQQGKPAQHPAKPQPRRPEGEKGRKPVRNQ